MLLLVHITFFDNARNSTGSNRGSVTSKSSPEWREFNCRAVIEQLHEMEHKYTLFRRIDVIVDVNEGNRFAQRLPYRTSDAAEGSRVHLQVDVHKNLSHPFRLAWAHRAHVEAHAEAYDWCMYTEADVFVPSRAIVAQFSLAEALYERRRLVVGFTRVVNNSAGNLFFSDIRVSASRGDVVHVPGLGDFVEPPNTYAAAWAYPRTTMRRFLSSVDWFPKLRSARGMRERAGWGWRSARIVTLADDDALFVYHYGKSGIYYARDRGFNSLPVNKLVVPHDAH